MKTLNRAVLISGILLAHIAVQAGTALEIQNDGKRLTIGHDGQELLGYQVLPMQNPKGGDAFKGSNFIHPLRTPSGFAVTDLQPKDHLHHFGVWWPWKYIEVDGRKIVCWELQKGKGLIQGRQATVLDNGFVSESDYIDRTAPGGPLVVLNEETSVRITGFKKSAANGYYLDIEITHRCATEHPVEVSPYRYSGFGYRGAASWNKDTSTILTSEGKDRSTANFTRADWTRIQGATPDGGTAGVLLMGHPDNRDHPEMLRTWDKQQHNGAIFVNLNPVQEKPWKFEPGKKYTRRYRMFVYDGKISKEQAKRLWKEYENEK
ncbi:MAG: PmoA family protein [Verrucomicrobia bacterium]|nr:PmoA family protein [Verrucomicrobiota bacterium]